MLGVGYAEQGPAVRPSMSPTRTHDQLTAVVHRMRNLHPRPPLNPEGDRRGRLARFCVRRSIQYHVVPLQSDITRLVASKILRSQVNKITLQWFAKVRHVLPLWPASVNGVALRHACSGQEYGGKARYEERRSTRTQSVLDATATRRTPREESAQERVR